VIDPTAKIECDELVLGEGTIIRAHAEIYGGRVELGRDSFVDEYAVIGGGSAGDLTTGDWFHLGMFAQVNTARPVTIGEEVGIGIGSRVFTHGAYLSELDGYPATFSSVTIGDRVWLPQATVLPGVTIGSDVVVAAGSVVTDDLHDHALYGGTPARWLKPLGGTKPDPTAVLNRICQDVGVFGLLMRDGVLIVEGTLFDPAAKTIVGPCTPDTERLRNELRRHGIRFRVHARGDQYEAWT
jgi:acetyltransferase-like isoleucine patch superfamily enzyme